MPNGRLQFEDVPNAGRGEVNIWWRRFFLILSVGGGFAGFAFTAGELVQFDRSLSYYVLCVGAMALYAFGVFGGLQLVEEKTKGVSLLSWYFLLQIPILISPIFSYEFSSGFTLSVIVGNSGATWTAFLGGR